MNRFVTIYASSTKESSAGGVIRARVKLNGNLNKAEQQSIHT